VQAEPPQAQYDGRALLRSSAAHWPRRRHPVYLPSRAQSSPALRLFVDAAKELAAGISSW